MTERDHTTALTAPDAHVPERLHPLVSAAMQQGSLDPATLRELLTLQREWQADEARRAYTAAMVALKRDLPSVLARDQLVAFKQVRYRHTSLAAAMDAITGPLQTHGFSVSWTPATSERLVSVTCRLTHAAGHSEETTLDAPADTSGQKSPAQAIASTITLLQRYTLLALLGIATADHVEDGPDAIDAERNLRAVTHLRRLGVSVDEAEHRVDAPVSEWTSEHLARLREWARDLEASGGAAV